MTMRLLCSALLAVAACGSEHTATGPDAAPTPDAPGAFVEAMPATFPQLVNLGGNVLATPKLQNIFFTGDDATKAMIDDFSAKLATSSYWTTAASEYGVGAPTVLPTIVLTEAPPTTGTALTNLLKKHLTATGADWTYDPSTIYSVYLPAGVVVTDSDGSKSCQDYYAYHDEITGTKPIIYALMPRCDGPPGTSAFDELTESASHEWLEAATDPLVQSKPTWGDADPEHYVWAYTPGAENGDYCEYLDAAYQKLEGTNYMIQRTWSNAAAKAGHDPCVPALAAPYVAAYPVLTEDMPIDGYTGGTIMTKAVQVPMAMSKTIDVKLFSDQPTEEFSVSAIDVAGNFGGTAELAFAWDKTTGKNGDTLHLTITRKAAGSFKGSEFAIVTSVNGMATNMWWSFAAN